MKSILIDQLFERNPGEDSVFACLQPFFQNILVQGNAHIVLEHMGNVVFAGVKIRS